MLRSAAKNWLRVCVVSNTKYYQDVIQQLRQNNGQISKSFRFQMSCSTFAKTAQYDTMIANYLEKKTATVQGDSPQDLCMEGDDKKEIDQFADMMTISLS